MCSGGSCVACTASPHLATDVQPIFDSNCAVSGCHVGPFPASGLDLEASVSYAQLVGHTSTLCGADTRVVAGTPSASVIIFALTGVASSDGCSPPPMPFGMPPLPNSQIDLVRAWICSGAPNN
jgi:hypothetical protein